MKRLLRLFGIVLALLWAPITSHCTWEDAPGLQFLKCLADAEENSDCDADACSMLETPDYKISDTRTAVPPPMVCLLFQLSLPELVLAERPLPVAVAPPEIPWQFSFRTALLPRAPSFAS